MINNSNSTKRSTDSKSKKNNKNDGSDSAKISKKTSPVVDSLASKTTADLTDSTIDKTTDSKSKKNNKNDGSDSAKNKSNNISPLKLDDLKENKEGNKGKEQLSYYEKQVLKELKGIRKASKNILKALRKFNT
jgi:hypothetical protein